MGKIKECHLRVALAVTVWLRRDRGKTAERSPRSGPCAMRYTAAAARLWRGRAFVTPSVLSIACRNPLECDRPAVAETLRTSPRRDGIARIVIGLLEPNGSQLGLDGAPLALNVALGLIACPLMKVHGVAANRGHPNSSLA
jgi:hypothetical protein